MLLAQLKTKAVHVFVHAVIFMCMEKWIDAVFTGLWESLECYWPITSLSSLCNTMVDAYFHSGEFNIRLFILNWGIGYLVHSILILQLQWHLGEQLFSDLLLPTAATMQISWWNPSTVQYLIFKLCQNDEPWLPGSIAEALVGHTHACS